MFNNKSTIAAISTPHGNGGISIVRISGTHSINIVDKIFKSKYKLVDVEPWSAVLGKIVDDLHTIDEVIVIVFKTPKSYTKEDMVEIYCHGGIYITQRILDLLLRNGAELAQPGEFTLRAFLNGRLDLTQAEAVADLIKAKSEISLKSSLKQLDGQLYKKIERIRNKLVDACSLLELELDFSDEDVEFVDRNQLICQIQNILNDIKRLIDSYKSGRLVRDGIKTVIIGKPNVGKSSLLNAIVSDERAIVTDIPGTTRDTLEVQLDLKGIIFNFLDTAGINESTDIIELEGIRRTKKQIEKADIILQVLDGSKPLDKEDDKIYKLLNKYKEKKIIQVINKNDLPIKIDSSKLSDKNNPAISISSLLKDGIEELKEVVFKMAVEESDILNSDEVSITNLRHLEALNSAFDNLKQARFEIENHISSEFITVVLRDALNDLGKIIGVVTSEDILNNIFKKFCIGK